MNNSALLKLLKVEADEWPTFAQMLGHSFFNSLGIAFSFTAINVLLINLHGIEQLPWIYLFGGLMVLGFGRIYAYLESRVPSVQLFAGVLLFGVSWTLMARGLTIWGDTMFMLAVLYALYLALYQLINLEFWGAAALIYDVRQSKRLFGLLSTGESVAKMGGYLATPFIVSVLSLSDLLFFAAASFGISFFFLFQLSRVNTRALFVDHDHHKGDHHVYHRKNPWSKFLEIIPTIKDSYLRITGLFALFSALVYYLVHYSFLNRVQVHFDNIDELAFFFGMFFGVGKGINLLIKLFLYSRIFNNMKIGFIILLFPLTIGILAFSGMVGQFFVADDLLFFLWVFGFIMLMDEVLRTSIYLPSFFILFQPLKKHQRLEGHTIAKGYMEPIGMAVAGLLMVGLMWQNVFRLDIIILFLGAAAFCWIGIGVILSGKYREKVSHLLKNRLLTSSNIQLTVDEMEMLSGEDNKTDDPVTKLYRLKLLGAQMQLDERNAALIDLLKSDSEMILYESLSLVDAYPNEVFWPYLIELLNHPNDSICQRASFVYCKHLHEESLAVMQDVISDGEGRRLEYYISAVLKYSGLYGAIQYGRILMDMIESKKATHRKSAARIVAMIGRADYYHPLTILINDTDKKVRKEAIIATSSVANERLLPMLIQRYRETDISRYSARAIEGFGPVAIPYISLELKKLHPREDLIRFVKLIGRMRGVESEKILFSIISHEDFEYRKESIYGLFRMETKFANREKINSLENLLKFELEIFELLKGQLFRNEGKLENYLGEAFKDEVRQLKNRVLRILGLIYDKHLIQKALDNLRNKDAFLRSNVLEMLETEIKMKHCKCVIPILEFKLSSVSLGENKNEADSRRGILSKILDKPMIGISDWTLALLLRYYRENNLSIDKNDLKRLREMRSDVVSQELNNQN